MFHIIKIIKIFFMFVVRVSGNLSFKAIKVFYVRVHFWYCLNCFANFRRPFPSLQCFFMCFLAFRARLLCVHAFGLLTQNFSHSHNLCILRVCQKKNREKRIRKSQNMKLKMSQGKIQKRLRTSSCYWDLSTTFHIYWILFIETFFNSHFFLNNS